MKKWWKELQAENKLIAVLIGVILINIIPMLWIMIYLEYIK